MDFTVRKELVATSIRKNALLYACRPLRLDWFSFVPEPFEVVATDAHGCPHVVGTFWRREDAEREFLRQAEIATQRVMAS